MRFLLSMLPLGLTIPFFLQWGISQSEKQIDKMQASAFDTPGTESPIPPYLILCSAGLVGTHFLIGSSLLGMKKSTTFFSLMLSIVLGCSAFFFTNMHHQRGGVNR